MSEIIEFIKRRVSYKPNTRLTASLVEGFGVYEGSILITMEVVNLPDVNRPVPVQGETTTVMFRQSYNAMHLLQGGPGMLCGYLRDFFLMWEKHEMDEWYCIDHKKVNDPHAAY